MSQVLSPNFRHSLSYKPLHPFLSLFTVLQIQKQLQALRKPYIVQQHSDGRKERKRVLLNSFLSKRVSLCLFRFVRVVFIVKLFDFCLDFDSQLICMSWSFLADSRNYIGSLVKVRRARHKRVSCLSLPFNASLFSFSCIVNPTSFLFRNKYSRMYIALVLVKLFE